MSSTVDYRFEEFVEVDRFIIFATCDPLLRDLITASCRLPLFDFWFIPDDSAFQDSVDELLSSVEIGVQYTDADGRLHDSDVAHIAPQDVRLDRWPNHLAFFRESIGAVPKQSVSDHYRNLRVFECDLREVTGTEQAIASIQRLTLRSTTLQKIDVDFCYWHAQFPCYVDRITFDVKDMQPEEGTNRVFRIVPFTLKSGLSMSPWSDASELTDLEVNSWLLAGHGAALLWMSIPVVHEHESGGSSLKILDTAQAAKQADEMTPITSNDDVSRFDRLAEYGLIPSGLKAAPPGDEEPVPLMIPGGGAPQQAADIRVTRLQKSRRLQSA